MTPLYLKRYEATEAYTIGALFLDGRFACYTLEDPCRTGRKIPGETAIPAGVYRVNMEPSQRFGRLMPRLVNVPHFTGILIHGGNRVADTRGCPLVGLERTTQGVRTCAPALALVVAALTRLDQQNDVAFLTLEDAVGWPSGPLTDGTARA